MGWNNWENEQSVCYVTTTLPRFYIEGVLAGHVYFTLSIIVIIYIIIFRTVKLQRKRIADLSVGSDAEEAKRKFSSDVKTVINLGLVVVAFTICYVPYVIFFHIVLSGDPTNIQEYMDINTWSSTLLLCNSALNPIIYATRMKTFRKAYKAILCCDKECNLEH